MKELFDTRVVVFSTETGSSPFFDYFDTLQPKLQVRLRAIIAAILVTGPSRFRPCANWLPMRGDLQGLFEIRFVGPGRRHHRVFCVIEKSKSGDEILVLLDGDSKANGELFDLERYQRLTQIRDDYLNSTGTID